MQAFKITRNLETKLLKGSTVGDVLTPDRVLLISDDNSRIIYIYRGEQSSFVLYLISIRLANEIRKEMRGFYTIKELKGKDAIQSIKKNTISIEGKIKEIYNPYLYENNKNNITNNQNEEIEEEENKEEEEKEPLKELKTIDISNKMQINQDSAWRERLTIKKAIVFDKVDKEIQLKNIQKNQEVEGYFTEMILLNNDLYSWREKLTSFFDERKVEKKFKQIGKLNDGFFFLPGYSSRLSFKGGKLKSLEFLKKIKNNKNKIENKIKLNTIGEIRSQVLKFQRISQERSITDMENAFQIPEPEPIENLIKKIKNITSKE